MEFIKIFLEQACWFDWAMVSGILLSMLLGFWRGFIRESLAIVAWIFGVMLILNYVDDLANWMQSWIHIESIRLVLSSLILLVVMFVMVQWVKRLLLWCVAKAGIRSLDHVLGGGFGVFRGVIMAMLVTILTARIGFAEERWWSDSVLTPLMIELNEKIPNYLPKNLKVSWQEYVTTKHKVRASDVPENIPLDLSLENIDPIDPPVVDKKG